MSIPSASEDRLPVTRRAVLQAGIAGGVLLAAPLGTTAALVNRLPKIRFRDLSPNADGVHVVRRPVLVDKSEEVREILVTSDGALVFHPDRSVTLRVTRNVVVEGELTMAPSAWRHKHKLIFHRVDETRFVGGGMTVVPSDTGLWVMQRGRIDIRGTAKSAWVRLKAGARRGDRVVRLAAKPEGWRAGDLLTVTPTLPTTHPQFSTAYDTARIKSITGSEVVLDRRLNFSHPAVKTQEMTLTAQVLNLSRNVSISGTASGRAHVFITARRRQRVRYAELTHLGPRQPDGDETQKVAGRYALHFHMMGEGARDSEVTGVVARQTGNHSFVPHESHGINFTSCIAHDVQESAYWWDLADSGEPSPQTNDTTYKACVASKVQFFPQSKAYRLSGFVLAAGNGNRARFCTAVGVAGSIDSSGITWPKNGQASGEPWAFADCVSHNNSHHGIFNWQNSSAPHTIRRSALVRNGHSGLRHGGYLNNFVHEDLHIVGNGVTGIYLVASSREGQQLTFRRVVVDGEFVTESLCRVQHHRLAAEQPTLLRDVTVRRCKGPVLIIDDVPEGSGAPTQLTLRSIRVVNSGPLVVFSRAHPESWVRWVSSAGTSLFTPSGRTGPRPSVIDPVKSPELPRTPRIALAP